MAACGSVVANSVESGCRIEDRRLDDAHTLEACLAIDPVVALRIYRLTMAGREAPDSPCTQFLGEDEWRVLSAWAAGTMAETPPSAHQVTRWIGKLGGWLPRGKHDHPGTTCMWRGLVRVPDLVHGYMLALRVHGIRDGP